MLRRVRSSIVAAITNADRLVFVCLYRLEPWLEFGMEIKQTAKSAAIRLSVPSIERFDDFEEEKEHVAIAVNAAMRLAVLGKRERERLDQALSLT